MPIKRTRPKRNAWRIRLKNGLSAERDRVEETPLDELAAFEAAIAHVEKGLPSKDSFLPGQGWVGFATRDALLHSGSVSVPMPDFVRWERGLHIAPYIRALKQNRAVLVVLLDHREARIFRYRRGRLEHLTELEADTALGDLSDIGTAKRATTRSGIRGKTATDAAQALLDQRAKELIDRLKKTVEPELRGDVHLIAGGIQAQVSAFVASLPESVRDHVMEVAGLHLEMSESELLPAVERGASEMTQQRSEEMLDEAIGLARSGGAGTLGLSDTTRAVREHRVRTLLVSEMFSRENPDLADRLIGTAAGGSGADVLMLVRRAGERLDEVGEGVGAILHYALPKAAKE